MLTAGAELVIEMSSARVLRRAWSALCGVTSVRSVESKNQQCCFGPDFQITITFHLEHVYEKKSHILTVEIKLLAKMPSTGALRRAVGSLRRAHERRTKKRDQTGGDKKGSRM